VRLSEVSPGEFEEKKHQLPPHLGRRAEHFFSEIERVHAGAKSWQESNLELFGELMNQSCKSSINHYECGSEILIELHELVSNTKGIYGSRFSGGGYGGCVIALAHKDAAASACVEIAEKFSVCHPELPSQVFITGMGDGIASVITGQEVEARL
jgi:galactokinase